MAECEFCVDDDTRAAHAAFEIAITEGRLLREPYSIGADADLSTDADLVTDPLFAGDYMYMGKFEGKDQFKHRDTREYLK